MRPGVDVPRGATISELSAGSASVAVAWVLLYELNRWLFADATVSSHVSWIFLPAAIRMLAVMLFEWAGVLGLLVGAIACTQIYFDVGPGEALTVSMLSAISPMIAYVLTRHWFGLPRELRGLTPRHLLAFAVAGGLSNTLLHQGYFLLSAKHDTQLVDAIPMFVGDVVGTLVVLYLAAAILKLVRRPAR
jgi:hypothetical protein